MTKSKKNKMRSKVRNRAERNVNRGNNGMMLLIPEEANQWSPSSQKSGKIANHNIDIVPYIVQSKNHPEVSPGEEWYERTYWRHFNIGTDNKAFICPKTIGQPCPICEYVKELRNQDDEESKQMVEDMKAKERQLFNLVDVDNPDKGVQIYEESYHNFGKTLDTEVNEGEEEFADFAEREGGYTLKVKFGKEKLGQNPFWRAKSIEFEERDNYEESIYNEVFDLDELLNIKDYETIKNTLFDLNESDEREDENEGDSSKNRKSRRNDDVDEDENGNDEGDANEDGNDEDEKSTRRQKPVQKKRRE